MPSSSTSFCVRPATEEQEQWYWSIRGNGALTTQGKLCGKGPTFFVLSGYRGEGVIQSLGNAFIAVRMGGSGRV